MGWLSTWLLGKKPETMSVPLLPLGQPLYPGGELHLRMIEPRYQEMVRLALSRQGLIGVCAMRPAQQGSPASPERLGCLARITALHEGDDGALELDIQADRRFRCEQIGLTESGLFKARVEISPAAPPEPVPETYASCAGFLQTVRDARPDHPADDQALYQDAVWVSYRLAEVLPFKPLVKQKLLELDSAADRLQVIHRFLLRQDLVQADPLAPEGPATAEPGDEDETGS